MTRGGARLRSARGSARVRRSADAARSPPAGFDVRRALRGGRTRRRRSPRSGRCCRSSRGSSTCAGAARAAGSRWATSISGSARRTRRATRTRASSIFYPGGVSETELLLAYGYVSFASKAGPLAGNHFATIVGGSERPAHAHGRRLLWEGAREHRLHGRSERFALGSRRNDDLMFAPGLSSGARSLRARPRGQPEAMSNSHLCQGQRRVPFRDAEHELAVALQLDRGGDGAAEQAARAAMGAAVSERVERLADPVEADAAAADLERSSRRPRSAPRRAADRASRAGLRSRSRTAGRHGQPKEEP